MKAVDLLEAIGYIDDKYIVEAASYDPGKTVSFSSARKVFRMIAIAAALVMLLSCTVLAADRLINSPERAWKVAQEQIEKMKDIGILASDVELADQPETITEVPRQELGSYWYQRILRHRYSIISRTTKYLVYVEVDTTNGRIYKFTIEAQADSADVPTSVEKDPATGDTYTYYENYEDILPAGMTVGRYCSLLCGYWGYKGYTLSGTQDDFYGYSTDAPSGDMLLTELSEDAYLTVYFDGDQRGAPMYIQLSQFPGSVSVAVGTVHLIG